MALHFVPSRIDGAGYVNCVAQRGDGRAVCGSDVGGINWSDDLGDIWHAANASFYTGPLLSVSSVAWSQTMPNRVYATLGKKGAGGGFARSDDGGKTWAVISSLPQFSGGNNDAPLPTPHPRSTFALKYCLDEQNGYIYVPTYSQGVYRSSNAGVSWTYAGLSGHYLRGLALDPNNPTHLIALSYGVGGGLTTPGVYTTSNARATSPSWSLMASSPTTPEEVWFSPSGKMYVPDGLSGVKRYDGSWSTLLNDGAAWMSVDGYEAGLEDVVVFGCFDPVKVGDDFHTAKFSIDSGDTLTDLDPAAIHYEMNDAGGDPWWLSVAQANQMLGLNSSAISQIDFDPIDTDLFMFAGRAGVWRTINAGLDYYPVVTQLDLTISRTLAFFPGNDGDALVGLTDWVDAAINVLTGAVIQNKPSPNTALAIAVDPVDGEALLAVGDRDENTLGRIYRVPAPGTGTWIDTILQGSVGAWTDLFNRSASSAWGNQDTGDAWALAVTTTPYNVDGEAGTILISAGASVDAHSPDSVQDAIVLIQASWTTLAAGSFHTATIKQRRVTTTFYGARLRQLSTNGNVVVGLTASGTLLGSEVVIDPHAAALTKYNVKFQVDGLSPTNLHVKAWREGDEEPADWQIETTDSTAAMQTSSGTIGLRAQSGAGYTGGATAKFHSFEAQNMLPVSGSDGKRPLGVASIRDGSNNRIWLAAIQEYGIRRSVNRAAWSDADVANAMQLPQSTKSAIFAWELGTPNVYLFDRAEGIWRSTDYGATWESDPIWEVTVSTDGTGYIAVDDDGSLYVATTTFLDRIDAPQTGTVP